MGHELCSRRQGRELVITLLTIDLSLSHSLFSHSSHSQSLTLAIVLSLSRDPCHSHRNSAHSLRHSHSSTTVTPTSVFSSPIELDIFSDGFKERDFILKKKPCKKFSAELVERVVLLGAPIAIMDENWEAARKSTFSRISWNPISRYSWNPKSRTTRFVYTLERTWRVQLLFIMTIRLAKMKRNLIREATVFLLVARQKMLHW
ncbi:hypothetical protein RIF29_16354 [Crotalaria pallida]|uniref:Uncharacterized protein n=1 Tax=Crotalaria pallida TaxID=3830 RepID=A0AAN9IFH2_CROPI